MKIVSIENIGKNPVYDISVEEAEHYVLSDNNIISHNSGILYLSNNVLMISRSQVKNGTDVVGYKFTINVSKSRSVREKSKMPFTVTFDGGIDIYSGLIEYALALGFVTKPKNGWYTRPNIEGDKNWRMAETSCKEFWEPLLNDNDFKTIIHNAVSLDGKLISSDEEFNDETGEILEGFEDKLDQAIESGENYIEE